ncbi:MAG: hypothetical protein B6D77_10935, partial [gamma proteobacterium symbiont of Ctena orbiculata]
MAVTIVGCGDIGTRVALACRADGSRVTAWVRTPESAQRLRRLGVNAVQADLDRALAPDHTVEEGVLYYFAPP